MINIALQQDLLNEEDLNYVTYAKFWPRVGAFLIDRVVMLVISPLALYNAMHWKNYLLFTALLFVQFSYKPLLEYTYGATLGKKALGIKIVNDQYQKPGFAEIFLRNIILIAEFIVALLFGLYSYHYKSDVLNTANGSYKSVYIILFTANASLFILNIIDVLFLATAKDG